jgi:hypothetical protein
VVTLTSLATEYFGEIEAPTKELALIPDAGHFAAFTQPERFLTELRTQVRPLASATSSLHQHAAVGGQKPAVSSLQVAGEDVRPG